MNVDSPALRTATTRHVTKINRTAILDVLRTAGPLSRRQIRERTGLGSATVDRLCATLASEGLIERAEQTSPSGGRPSHLLRYVASSKAIIAVDLTEKTARGRIVDMGGHVVHEEQLGFDLGTAEPGRARLDGLLGLVDGLLTLAGTGGRPPIAAIGVVLPGIADQGVITHAVELDWSDVPLADILSSRFQLPIQVENDANATAYAEWTSGAHAGARSLVALVLGTRLSAGVVNDGTIHHGHHSAAGEIGFLLTSRDSFGRYFPDQGDLESQLASGLRPFAPSDSRRVGPAFRDMMLHVSEKDPDAAPAHTFFFDQIALAIAAVSAVLAPEVIVLASAFAQYSDESIAELRRRLTGRIPWVPELVSSTHGFDSAIVGISALTIDSAREATYLR